MARRFGTPRDAGRRQAETGGVALNRKWILAGSMLYALLMAISAVRATSAPSAMTFTVNSTNDVVDAIPGDGKCETAPGNGICTLRAATMEADSTSGATIVVPAGEYNLQIPSGGAFGASGALWLANVLTLSGAGANSTIIDGNSSVVHDRVINAGGGSTIRISGVTIRDGSAATDGGGILSGANLTLLESVVRENFTSGSGGGIATTGLVGRLTLVNTSVDHNASHTDGGGISSNNAPVILNDSAVDSNTSTSGNGGGIASIGNTVTLNNSAVRFNTAYYAGGGIALSGYALLTMNNSTLSYDIASWGGGLALGNAAATLSGDTISLNSANGVGGGAVIIGISDTLKLINSTVSYNLSARGGGGIFSQGSLNLYNATIADNEAGYANGQGTVGWFGGGIYNSAGTVNFRNSLLAYNAHYISSLPFFAYDDCIGSLTSQGYNLIYTTTNCTVGGIAAGNKLNVDPKLDGALKFNGGPTPTHALLAGSPAIDAGNPSGCTDNLGAPLTTDQRGFPRVDGDGNGSVICDIGAYEYGSILRLWLPLVRR